jgi:predicted metal-binding membrane protein
MAEGGLAERVLRRDKIAVVVLIGLLFVLAGLYTVYGVGMRMTALEMTAMRGMRDMPGPRAPGSWPLGYALIVFLMWWVMMIAMMLPSIAPTVLLHGALLRRGAAAPRVPAIAAAFLAGYVVVWAGFSLLATATQWVLEAHGIVSATMLTLIQTVPGGLVLLLAGMFQFTPLKKACLQHCRSPADFITRRRRSGTIGAFAMGLEHGLYCLGCCWFLMALLFVGGIMNLYWIVGLAVFVTVEKLAPRGDLAGKAAGVILMLWGSTILWRAL